MYFTTFLNSRKNTVNPKFHFFAPNTVLTLNKCQLLAQHSAISKVLLVCSTIPSAQRLMPSVFSTVAVAQWQLLALCQQLAQHLQHIVMSTVLETQCCQHSDSYLARIVAISTVLEAVLLAQCYEHSTISKVLLAQYLSHSAVSTFSTEMAISTVITSSYQHSA